MSRPFASVAAFFAVLCFAFGAWAQTYGALTGSAEDVNGGPVAGIKVTLSGPGIPPNLRELVVNGTLELVATGADGVVMREGQLLSGTGTVRIMGSGAANADLRKAGNDLKIIAIPR